MSKRLQSVNSLCLLLEGVVDTPVPDQLLITGLNLDSRTIGPGELFVGIPGTRTDGRSHIRQAISAGARAVLLEARGWSGQDCEVPCYQVENLRRHIGLIASRFYGFPSKLMCVIGFTGTNGKTTCAGLVAQALETLGRRSGVIGTIGRGPVNNLQPASLTTPNAVDLQAELAKMVESGLDSVCVEVSSHALDQGRVGGVEFDTAVFTNLSRDHLDYHCDMDAYAATKFRLFQNHGVRSAIINSADPRGAEFVAEGVSGNMWTYGVDASADVYPQATEVLPDGIRLQLSTPTGCMDFQVSLLGQLNVANLVAVVTVLLALGYSPEEIESTMPTLKSIPGRMELFCDDVAAVRAVVDYAHTPAALEQALDSLRKHTTGRLWCVFGCGGERDQGKRPLMGTIAERLADEIILTDDNPRGEDSLQILDQIESGIQSRKVVRIPDRQQAIKYAIGECIAGDLVLIAGKGHEAEQIVGSKRIPLSDRNVVANLLGG